MIAPKGLLVIYALVAPLVLINTCQSNELHSLMEHMAGS